MTRIKLCGLQRPEEILMANELKVDAVGFVFYEKSKRFLSMEQAKELKRSLSSKITAIGVFVNAELSEIEELLSLEILVLENQVYLIIE